MRESKVFCRWSLVYPLIYACMFTRYGVSRDDLTEYLASEPAYRVEQVWTGLHRRALRPSEMTELPLTLRERLDTDLVPALREVSRVVSDNGQTVKWLWQLEGDVRVETVLMLYSNRVTVCVSTQAGCAMACQFCATGQGGFSRNLTEGEIVEQLIEAARAARPRRISNVVFMGMGEPLANYERVWAAIKRINKEVGISARNLTISTVGIVPGIRRLSSESLPVNLAVSLHAANDDLRNRLVPINRRYPLSKLSEACANYVAASGRRLSLEWAMISGVNDRDADIEELANFAIPLKAHVNLIPLNPTPGYIVAGTPEAGIAHFRDQLDASGVNATIRTTRGVEIDAACGQLVALHNRD